MQSWKSKYIKWQIFTWRQTHTSYLNLQVVYVYCINSHFRACDRYSVMVKHIYPTAYLYSAEQNYFWLHCCISLLLYNIFYSLPPPALHCSVSSAPLPLVSRDTWGRKQGRDVSRWGGMVRQPKWGSEAAEVSPWRKEIVKAFKLKCLVSSV